MRAIVTRVAEASVRVDGALVGECGPGLLVLAAAHRDDDMTSVRKCADRIAGLRIFNDADGKMNLALRDVPCDSNRAQLLVISNFTVLGDTAKSRRPSFGAAAGFVDGERLFAAFLDALRTAGYRVATGVFGADMQVESVNNGPVTVIVETVPPSPIER